MRLHLACLAAGVAIASAARTEAQTARPRYPVVPEPLADAAEIALALSAAPQEVSDSAGVMAVLRGEVRTLRKGSSGSMCMVSRDFHEGSAYPICFNPAGARSALQKELFENKLRSLGVPEDSVQRASASAMERGEIPAPQGLAMAYMMSPRQVLFSEPGPDGRRVGAWHPHLMIYSPKARLIDLGIMRESASSTIQLTNGGERHAEIAVLVPRWSDGALVSHKP